MSFLQIFYARPPVPGQVKTRLAEFLGDTRACELYTRILSEMFRRFAGQKYEVHSASDTNIFLLQQYTPNEIYIQQGRDLGERMAHSLYRAAERSSVSAETPLLLTGTDIPSYNVDVARQAASLLNDYDAVLGPAADGGYYLIGMRAELAAQRERVLRLFAGIDWSTPAVYVQQQERLRQAGLRVIGLPTMNDLDTFSDLMHARNQNGFYLHEFIPDIRAILPVYNEAENLEYVLRPLIASHMFREIICADNGSTDDSPAIARSLGCHVTFCAERGYGATCLEAMRHIEEQGGCDVILFMDADGSDDPADLSALLAPLASNRADMVLGHRAAHMAEVGALLPHQRFGNWLSTFLIRIFWKHAYADLGPFRGLRWSALRQLRMRDRNFGWTVEMQIRALKAQLRILEIPVRYRRRHAGQSKVTATVRGSFRAGQIILTTVFRELWYTLRRRD